MIRHFSLMIAASWLVAGCASNSSPDMGSEFQALGPKPTTVATAPDYKIGPLDRLSITVFQSKDLSQPSVQVDTNGQLLLPVVGVVMAAGKTNTELSAELATRLADCCLRDPDVAVQVTEAVSQQVTVTGAVTNSGVFVLRGRSSLLQAISMAGGADRSVANTKRIAVYRVVDGQRMGALFNLDEIRAGKAEDPQIFAGDTIIVDTSGAKSAWRNVVAAIPFFSVFRPF